MGIPRRDFGLVQGGGRGGKVWDWNVRKGSFYLIGDWISCCGLIGEFCLITTDSIIVQEWVLMD